ncbi:TPA: hypothetical protein PTV30_000085 [Clostridium botulinum]|nr:hypothetical protein [Clostridium botulinum]
MIDNSIELNIKAFHGSNRYKLRFWYKGDLYETIYGYSVDLDINLWYYLENKDKVRLEKCLNN